jgi:cell volume regulation protein A
MDPVLSQNILLGAFLLFLSIFASKFTDRIGIPGLLIFLGIGMLVGSDGFNWIYLDDPKVAQTVGVFALMYILFSGGLDTDYKKIRPVIGSSLVLATLGVLLSAGLLGLFAKWLLGFSWLESMLVGAIVSSTDAAAVFSVLRTRHIALKYRLQELIEFESGTNDPMAIFLTIGLITLIMEPTAGLGQLGILFMKQMVFGALAGYLFGLAISWILNQIELEYDGLYTVLTLALVALSFAITDLLGGSGFLAVYLVGLIVGNRNIVHKKSLMNFFDGISWLMQITMFLVLGLLVFPNQLIPFAAQGVALAFFLMFVARPVSVYVGLIKSPFSSRAKAFVSWVGLRGAVPIILATFPLVAGVPNADAIFHLIFFVVILSVAAQSTTIPPAAKLFHVFMPMKKRVKYPIEFDASVDTKSMLKEVELPDDSPHIGKQIIDLSLPPQTLIVLINRNGKFVVPNGITRFETGDKLLVLGDRTAVDELRILFGAQQSDIQNP